MCEGTKSCTNRRLLEWTSKRQPAASDMAGSDGDVSGKVTVHNQVKSSGKRGWKMHGVREQNRWIGNHRNGGVVHTFTKLQCDFGEHQYKDGSSWGWCIMRWMKYDSIFLQVNFQQHSDSTVDWNNPSVAGVPRKTESSGSCLSVWTLWWLRNGCSIN